MITQINFWNRELFHSTHCSVDHRDVDSLQFDHKMFHLFGNLQFLCCLLSMTLTLLLPIAMVWLCTLWPVFTLKTSMSSLYRRTLRRASTETSNWADYTSSWLTVCLGLVLTTTTTFSTAALDTLYNSNLSLILVDRYNVMDFLSYIGWTFRMLVKNNVNKMLIKHCNLRYNSLQSMLELRENKV